MVLATDICQDWKDTRADSFSQMFVRALNILCTQVWWFHTLWSQPQRLEQHRFSEFKAKIWHGVMGKSKGGDARRRESWCINSRSRGSGLMTRGSLWGLQPSKGCTGGGKRPRTSSCTGHTLQGSWDSLTSSLLRRGFAWGSLEGTASVIPLGFCRRFQLSNLESLKIEQLDKLLQQHAFPECRTVLTRKSRKLGFQTQLGTILWNQLESHSRWVLSASSYTWLCEHSSFSSILCRDIELGSMWLPYSRGWIHLRSSKCKGRC